MQLREEKKTTPCLYVFWYPIEPIIKLKEYFIFILAINSKLMIQWKYRHDWLIFTSYNFFITSHQIK